MGYPVSAYTLFWLWKIQAFPSKAVADETRNNKEKFLCMVMFIYIYPSYTSISSTETAAGGSSTINELQNSEKLFPVPECTYFSHAKAWNKTAGLIDSKDRIFITC